MLFKRPSNILFLFFFLWMLSTSAYAVLGLPDNTARVGYSFGVSRLVVHDPAGETQPVVALQPIKFTYSDWLTGGYRFWAESYYQEASLPAGEEQVGQYFQQGGGRFVVQRNFKLTDYIKPWLGLGMDLSLGRQSYRHTMDDEGYLLARYDDRLQPSAGALIYLVNEWQINRDWNLGGTLLQRISLNEGASETSLSVFFLMRL